MIHDLSELLVACSDLEAAVAEIYDNFAESFPEAYDLWHGLAVEEVGHASFLSIASKFAGLGKLPEIIAPELLTHMEGTVEMVGAVKQTVQEGQVTLAEALGMALNLERTVHESYLHHLLSLKTKSEIMKRLQNITVETESHIKKIKDYMGKSG